MASRRKENLAKSNPLQYGMLADGRKQYRVLSRLKQQLCALLSVFCLTISLGLIDRFISHVPLLQYRRCNIESEVRYD
jgi:hypothetical protein